MTGIDPLAPIPLTVLTGFLGAGKTTWLNAALRQPALAETLVIINEFGQAGLDHLLIEDASRDIVLMAAGCLCCSLRQDLVATLEDLLRRRDNNRIAPFRHIALETTGLADPLPILQSLLQHPYLAQRFELRGVIACVDAVHGAQTLASHEAARRQVALCDALLLTKTDIATTAQCDALRAALQAVNPRETPLTLAQFDAASLFQPRFSPQHAEDIAPWLGASVAASDHAAGIDSFTFLSDAPVSLNALRVFQQAMRVLHGPRLLRLKGIIHLAEHPEEPMVIHHVQSVAHPPRKLARWPGHDRRTRLVFITQGIAQETIAGFWNALAGAG